MFVFQFHQSLYYHPFLTLILMGHFLIQKVEYKIILFDQDVIENEYHLFHHDMLLHQADPVNHFQKSFVQSTSFLRVY